MDFSKYHRIISSARICSIFSAHRSMKKCFLLLSLITVIIFGLFSSGILDQESDKKIKPINCKSFEMNNYIFGLLFYLLFKTICFQFVLQILKKQLDFNPWVCLSTRVIVRFLILIREIKMCCHLLKLQSWKKIVIKLITIGHSLEIM